MIYLFIIGVAFSFLSLLVWGIFKMSQHAQMKMDLSRKSYTLVYPTGTTDKQIQTFLRSIGTSLVPNKDDRGATPTLVFEVRWTPKGVRHIIRITPQDDAHVKLMLDAHLPGITYDPVDTEDERLDIDPAFALTVEMTDCSMLLSIETVEEVANGILHSVPTVSEGEIVTYQAIVSHTSNLATPKSKPLHSLIFGQQEPDTQTLKDMEAKRREHNFNVALRIGVQAASEIRGRELAGGLVRTMRQANNRRVQLNGKVMHGDIAQTMSHALTPRRRSAQLTVTELSALMAAPINDPAVPGLAQGAARRLPATDAIPSDGEWLLGHNDIHGHEKPITLSKEFASQHVSVVGRSGSGKTVFLTNGIVQFAKAGLGIFVIDAGQDVSTQRLFYRTLDALPPDRAPDVICINPAEDPDNPVSINILDQDFGMGAISIVKGVFESLYNDASKGVVSVGDVLQHCMWTLIEAGGYTLVDLASLLSPRNEREWQWSKSLIDNVKDPELKDFWARHPGAVKPLSDTRGRADWDKYVAPTHRRLWQLASRPEIRYLLGQTKSTIKIKDVLEQNKILLFSVGGMDDADAAQLLASLITQMVWTAAQSVKPKEPNVLFLDEFQVSTRIQGGLPDMLARARALNLGLVLSTQYVTREDIPRELQSAVFNNTATRIVFRSASGEADKWSREFGRKIVTENDITRLHKYHAFAQVANPVDDRSPVTFKALKPAPDTNLTKQLLENSRRQYGRPVDQVRQEIIERRRVQKGTKITEPQDKSEIPDLSDAELDIPIVKN